MDGLLQKERIALCAVDQEAPEIGERRISPQERLQKFAGVAGRQCVEPELLIVGLASPAVRVFRPIIHQQEQSGRRHALNQGIEQGLSF